MLKKLVSLCTLVFLTLITSYQSSLAFDYNKKINWSEKLLALQEPCPYQESFDLYQSKRLISPDALCNESINKLDFLVFAMKAKGINLPEKFQFSPFKDVKNNDTTTPYIKEALELKLIPEEKFFYPEQKLIKVKALEMILNIHEMDIQESPTDFELKDVSNNSWYADIVFTNYIKGIIDNRSAEYFGPFDTVTYGMAAEMNKKVNKVVIVKEINYQSQQQEEIESYLNFYANIWEIIENNYLWEDSMSREEMINQSIKGLVTALDDPHSSFYTPQENEQFRESLKWEIIGIGVIIQETTDGYILITDVIPNSPADNARLRVGDTIIAVDDEDLMPLTLEDGVDKIKWEINTKVKITYKRGEDTFSVELIRKKVAEPNLDFEHLENNIDYLKIRKFTEDLDKEFAEIANKINKSNPKHLILDLRNNPGGYLDISVEIASYFLEKNDIIVQTVDKNGNADVYYTVFEEAVTKGMLYDLPITILVNDDSASAAEILAVSLQENVNATVVGEQTYGKGSAQRIYSFGNDSSLKLTIMEWLSPLNNHINDVGVTPNIIISDDFTTEEDEILEKALEMIK